MYALSIQPTYPIFTDIDGQPLEDGYVWIGTANLDPQTNPINVYWDAALTLPAAQPIRTLAGYPANSGTPARLYVNSDYSIRVMNKNGSSVYSAPAATDRYNDVVVSGVNAEDVIYDPPFTSAVQTNVEAKLAQTVSVKDFGAVGDGVTDDTAAFQNAFDASSVIYVPEGTYILSDKISLVDSSLTLYGAGTNASVLKWTNSDGGISCTNTTSNDNLYQFSNMTLLTTYAGGGTAIAVDVANNIPEPSIRMSNLSIRGDDKTTDWWTIGIDSNNGVVSYYENIYISGKEGAPQAGTKGIYLHQDSGAGAMVQMFNQIDIKFCDVGLDVLMTGSLGIEGIVMTASLVVQCNQCVRIDASGSSYVPPYYAFTSCQFDSAQKECLALVKLAQIFINDCVFYGDAVAANYPLVKLQQCNDFWINNSYFVDFATSKQRTGIYCHGGTGAGWIGPCTFGELVEGISLASDTGGIWVAPQQRFSNCTTNWINAGSGNVMPDGFVVGNNANSVVLNGGDGAIELLDAGGNAYIDMKSLSSEDADVRIQQTSNGLEFSTGGQGSRVIRLILQSDNKILMPTLPSSASGIPSGGIYYDAADGNRLKYVP